jgi:DNA end-binding protein Ku
MAARAISSGTISFGLVSIPVKVYSATSAKTVHFNMLDPDHHQRVRQQLVSSRTGEVVERGKTVKGYEYARGQYVVLDDEELKALERKSDGTIAIEEFVPIDKVDPVYFERTTFLGPDKGGQKAYRLLQQAMGDAGRVAVGRWNARGRQQLVLLRPHGIGLAMHSLFYADEVRSIDDVDIDLEIEITDAELDLARQLIDQLSSTGFDASRYEDTYRAAVLEAIDRKVAGEQVVVADVEEEQERIIDLVAALKQSLGEKAAASGRARKPAKSAGSKTKSGSARKKSTRKKASRSSD